MHFTLPRPRAQATRSSPLLDIGAWVGVAALLVVTVIMGSAFWLSPRPPLQDLPQHLAAVRVLFDRAHPGFRFDELFEVDWWRSQYLGTYVLLGGAFQVLRAFVDEPLLPATRLVLALLALAWPLSAELVYRQLGRRAGLGAFALVFFFNVHLILGFLNFVLGIVACLLALACLAKARAAARSGLPARRALLGWGASAFGCFYLHVVPFALLAGTLLWTFVIEVAPALWQRARGRRARAGLVGPYVAFTPALAAASGWLFTPAGVSTREAARGAGARGRAVYPSFEANRAELERWLMDAFASPWDTRWAKIALAVLGWWLLIELGFRAWARWRDGGAPSAANEAPGSIATAGVDPALDRTLLWALRAFVPASLLLYFSLPSAYDWIWPINARFPLLGALALPLWLPAPRRAAPLGLRVVRVTALCALLGCATGEAWIARSAFAGFQRELRGLDDVLAAIPEGQRTATLVFDRYSRHIGFAPFLHVGAYYQAERGGLSVFSFADFPQSPIRFREETRPPRLPPRWEWTPERVRERDLDGFDYVITRGGPGRVATFRAFEAVAQFGRYRLFRKRIAAAP